MGTYALLFQNYSKKLDEYSLLSAKEDLHDYPIAIIATTELREDAQDGLLGRVEGISRLVCRHLKEVFSTFYTL